MRDRIFPRKNTEFNNYVVINTPYLNQHAERLHVSEDYINTLNDFFEEWKDVFSKSTDPLSKTKVVNTERNGVRKNLEVHLRKIYGDIPKSKLTVTDRAALHLTLRRTAYSRVGIMNHSPQVMVEHVSHLAHRLRFRHPTEPLRRRMPYAQRIFLKWMIGRANLTGAEIIFSHAQTSGRHLFTVNFTEADAGKTAYYSVCYINRRGKESVMSVVLSMIII